MFLFFLFPVAHAEEEWGPKLYEPLIINCDDFKPVPLEERKYHIDIKRQRNKDSPTGWSYSINQIFDPPEEEKHEDSKRESKGKKGL